MNFHDCVAPTGYGLTADNYLCEGKDPHLYTLECNELKVAFELHIVEGNIDIYVFEWQLKDDQGRIIGDSNLNMWDMSPFAIIPEPYLAEAYLCHYGAKYIQERTKVLTTA